MERNSFNVLRCYVHLYGRAAQLHLAQHISQLEAEHARLLAALPQQVQQAWQRRKVEAAETESALKWTFPDLILAEGAYRQTV